MTTIRHPDMFAAERAVSVVIPTLNRPALLQRALRSVFAQSQPPTEIIVVVDGPDPKTHAALREMQHPLLKVIPNEQSLTAAGARNAGVAVASGQWIAFLDDDDEWDPRKLERQLDFALASGTQFVTCLSRVVTPEATYCWPTTIYNPTEPLDAYLFDRRTLFSGAAFVQSSSFLIRRDAFSQSPFRTRMPHDDWDFVIRQVNGLGTRFATVPEPLVIHYMNYDRKSLSSHADWRTSLAWLRETRPLFSRRGYSGFCLSVIGPRAAGEGALSAFPRLLLEAFRHGAPHARQLLIFLALWAIPPHIRRRLRARQRLSPIAQPVRPGSTLASQVSAEPVFIGNDSATI